MSGQFHINERMVIDIYQVDLTSGLMTNIDRIFDVKVIEHKFTPVGNQFTILKYDGTNSTYNTISLSCHIAYGYKIIEEEI